MRISLQQTFGTHTGRIVEHEDGVVRIGRHPDNDLAFHASADLDASAFHAELRYEQGAWFIIDLESRNGTWRKGERVTRMMVRSGDEFEFGPGGPRVRMILSGQPPAERMAEGDAHDASLRPAPASGFDVPGVPLWAITLGLIVVGIVTCMLAWELLK